MRSASRSSRRTRLLKHARALARTGRHADARSIVAALEGTGASDEVRDWLADARFVEQLNLLCTAAQSAAA